jgi:hypothetical protein
MKGPEHGLLDFVRESHVVFDRVETPQYKIEYAYLEGFEVTGSATDLCGENTRRLPVVETYDSSQLAVEFFDDRRKGTTGLVEEIPAFLHGFTIVTGYSEFIWIGDVAGWIAEEVELGERGKFERVS